MAKQSVVQRNLKRLKMSELHFEKRLELKKKIKDVTLSIQERFAFAQKLDAMPVDGSAIRYRKRCSITNRPRGIVHKSLGISRIMLRNLVAKGYLPGIRKASW